MTAPGAAVAATPGPAASDADGGGGAARMPPRPAIPRRGAVVLPALVAGVGLALSLPPWGFWILAFPGAGLLWWRLAGLSPGRRLWAGWVAGMGCFGPGLFWARSFTLPGALLLMAVEAAFFGLACLVTPAGPVAARALALPAAMTLVEAARDRWPFGGLPLGGVFLGQADGPLLGVARLAGPGGLTLVVWVGGVALGLAALAVTRARAGRGAGPVAVGAGCVLLGLAALAGTADHAPDGGPAVGHVTAAAVQGGGRRGFSMREVDPATVLAAQNAATAALVHRAQHPPPGGRPVELVVWPEDVVALPTLLAHSPEQARLADLARRLDATLLVGVTEDTSPMRFLNEVVAFGPDGRVVAHYEKVHRVPFGEYVPDRGFFAHLANLNAVPRDAVPGHGTGLMRTPAGPLGVMISFEVFYADRGRAPVRAGAQLLVVPTNTSSYATAQVPTQEVAASRIQAVQQGRDLIQAAPTGYSAVVTHRGVVEQRSVLGRRAVLTATVARRAGWTLYVRFGDVPVLALAAGALVAAWALALDRLRRGAGRPGGGGAAPTAQS